MTKSLTENDFFRTTDLPLASALLYFGYHLDSLEKGSPKATFIFLREEGLDKTVEAFWAGELLIEPKAFFNCQKEIKSRLYNEG